MRHESLKIEHGRLVQGGAESKRPLQLEILSGNTWFLSVGGTQEHLLYATHTCFPSPDRLSLNGRGRVDVNRSVTHMSVCHLYLAYAV